MRRLAVLSVLLVATAALAGETDPPKDWREAAKEAGLAAEAVERLAATKVLVAPGQCRQVFSPYVDSGMPPFVTSDSILHAYHVLLEEGLARAEQVRVHRLEEFLGTFWDGIPASAQRFDLPPERIADAVRRAQLTIGTALRVLGAETPGADAETVKLLDAEVLRVEAATERSKPGWLGPSDETFPFVDYGRCRPGGFYAADGRLSRYWRAVTWLQAIPFRVSNRDELTAAVLLRQAAGSSDPDWDRAFERSWKAEAFVRAFTAFVGGGDDLPVNDTSGFFHSRWNDESIAEAGKEISRREDRETTLRVLPPAAPEDVRLLEATSTPERAHATGLDVAAALGSSLARSRLEASEPEVLKRIDGAGEWNPERSLHSVYLHCLRALADPPEKEAPAFLRGEAWAAKSLNTLLAGWAQERHAFALQVRESVFYLSASMREAGFVEPVPEFYSRLADLATWARSELAGMGAFSDEPGRAELARSIRRFLVLVSEAKVAELGEKAIRTLSGPDREFVREMALFAEPFGGGPDRPAAGPDSDPDVRVVDAIRGSADAMRKLVTDLESGAPLPATVSDLVRTAGLREMERWNALHAVCRRLEAMAHKQLRGAEWNVSEAHFLRDYGEVVAHLVGYEGNSWLHARDDVPQATPVLAVHAARAPGEPAAYFHAAVGRPRLLFVLYPVGDREVLCRGAVMTYYEFARDARIGDDEWRAWIDSADAPAPPEWLGAATSSLRPAPWDGK